MHNFFPISHFYMRYSSSIFELTVFIAMPIFFSIEKKIFLQDFYCNPFAIHELLKQRKKIFSILSIVSIFAVNFINITFNYTFEKGININYYYHLRRLCNTKMSFYQTIVFHTCLSKNKK